MVDADEIGEESDEDESGEEITGLEAVLTPVVKDLSIDYTDDEDEDDKEVSELQTLAAPPTETLTRMASEQPQNNNDISNLDGSQFHQPRCKDVLSVKRSHDNLFPSLTVHKYREKKSKPNSAKI